MVPRGCVTFHVNGEVVKLRARNRLACRGFEEEMSKSIRNCSYWEAFSFAAHDGFIPGSLRSVNTESQVSRLLHQDFMHVLKLNVDIANIGAAPCDVVALALDNLALRRGHRERWTDLDSSERTLARAGLYPM
jgi:hypothetical protein